LFFVEKTGGNFAHGRTPCPPPADTLKWLKKHAKPCPNCHNQIQKNGGCDHMTCLKSAGGCGHEFWFTCGCNFKQPHVCSRGGGVSLPPGMHNPGMAVGGGRGGRGGGGGGGRGGRGGGGRGGGGGGGGWGW